MPTVYLNGAFLPLEEAHVPVLDRGFIFGDGVYEVIPVYSRRPFRLADHLARLQASLDGIRLANPHPPETWRTLVLDLIACSGEEDLGIYLQVTRGPAPRDQAFPTEVRPTVLIMPLPLGTPPARLAEEGVGAITAADNRWLRCDLKSTSLVANVLLRQLSVDAGCAETILLRDGWLTEGSSSSVFVVSRGTLLAPPKSHLILPGVTYDVVLELAAGQGVPYALRPIPEAELRSADEIWLTSSTKEILPVVRLDGRPVGDGRPGGLFRGLHAAYQEYKRTEMRGGGS
ncbi:MAG TPA: D-amino acid aminotransferase [Thiobacillaceae bacterium]|nr:D-amino acid aminotransferase [Thiobacillaceae bacterium]